MLRQCLRCRLQLPLGLLARCGLHPSVVLGIRKQGSIQDPSGTNGQIVHIGMPRVTEPTLIGSLSREQTVHNVAKILRSVNWAKGQTPGQVHSRPGYYGQHLACPLRIRHLVETSYRIQQGHVNATRHVRFHIIRSAQVVDCSKDSLVHPAVVDNQTSLPLPTVSLKFTSTKSW